MILHQVYCRFSLLKHFTSGVEVFLLIPISIDQIFFRTTFSVLEEKTKALLNHYLTIFSPNNNEYFYEFGCVIIVLYVSEWCTLNAIKVTWHKLWIFISFFLVSISRYFSLRGCSFIYYWAQSNDWIVRLKYFFLRIFF